MNTKKDKKYMKRRSVIAIIPTHGAGDAFVECVSALKQQTHQLEKIIIIDNNVQDNSIEKAVKAKKTVPITIIQLKQNAGVTGGRNAGIKALPQQYDYALFVDHDMIAKKNMLEELIKTAEKKDNIGIVTPKIYYWNNKKIIWSSGTDINLMTGQTIFYGGKDYGQYNNDRQVAVAPATFLVKKAVIDTVGQFDERYFATYEDTDFCFSARSKGFETWYCANAVAFHKIPYDPKEATKRLLERTYYIARNRYLFLRKFKYMSFISYACVPIYFMYYMCLAIQYRKFSQITAYIKGAKHGLTTKI